jgi:hypothetical protein
MPAPDETIGLRNDRVTGDADTSGVMDVQEGPHGELVRDLSTE